MEPRLEKAGMVLLRSLDLQGERTYPGSVEVWAEEDRHCTEVFIVLTREVLLCNAVGLRELEDPCKLMLE